MSVSIAALLVSISMFQVATHNGEPTPKEMINNLQERVCSKQLTLKHLKTFDARHCKKMQLPDDVYEALNEALTDKSICNPK